MMKQLKLTALAASMALGLGMGAAQAASVNSQLFGGSQLLSDSSAEVLVDVVGVGVPTLSCPSGRCLDIGDRLTGIITIEKLQKGLGIRPLGLGSPHDELTGIFSLTVVSKTFAPGFPVGTFTFIFAPSAPANFTTDTGGLVRPAGTVISSFDDPVQNFNRGGSVALGIASATGGSLQWDFGFTGSASEFFVTTTSTDDVAAISALPPGVNGGITNFGLGFIPVAGQVGLPLLPVPCLLGPVIACGNASQTSPDTASDFDIFDQAQIAINVLPEPGSLALMGLALAGLGFGSRRRKKQ